MDTMTIPDPLCMTPDELDAWRAAAEYVRVNWGHSRTDDPCSDCTLAFHLEQRALGACNGIPGIGRKPRRAATKDAIMQRLYHFRRVLVDKGLDPAHAERVA